MRQHYYSWLLLFVGVTFLVSCQKEDLKSGAVPQETEDPRVKDNFRALKENIPPLAVYNKKMDKVVIFDVNREKAKKNFSFSSPNSGWNFSNSSSVEFVESPQGGGVLFVGSGAFGGNTGGVVVAGESSLNIGYTFCFSASDEAMGLDPFSFENEFDGVSMVMGIAGDLDALQNEEIDENADPFDYFQGFAVYVVYDNEASGTYEILNWMQDLGQSESKLKDKGFAYVIDFQKEGLYFSSSGELAVNGGDINFNGKYFAFMDIFTSMMEGNGDLEDMKLREVQGFGTMGCN